jgi:hypothetical protein
VVAPVKQFWQLEFPLAGSVLVVLLQLLQVACG